MRGEERREEGGEERERERRERGEGHNDLLKPVAAVGGAVGRVVLGVDRAVALGLDVLALLLVPRAERQVVGHDRDVLPWRRVPVPVEDEDGQTRRNR